MEIYFMYRYTDGKQFGIHPSERNRPGLPEQREKYIFEGKEWS